MTSSTPPEEKPRQRSAIITDQAWTQLLAHSVLSKKSASLLCRQMLEDYLTSERKPVPIIVDASLPRATRSLYIPDSLWEAARLTMIQERRSVSKLLEQLIRQHLGLDPGASAELEGQDLSSS